jgi:hypothetical protein
MEFPKFKKKLRVLFSSLGRVGTLPKKIILSAGILTIASTSSMSQPPVTDPRANIKASSISKYSVKYLLRSAGNSFGRLLGQHRSHSSHSSHSSHYSGSSTGHQSHSSHYSSSYPAATPTPPSYPTATPTSPSHSSHSSHASHYSASGTTTAPVRTSPPLPTIPSTSTPPRSTRSRVVLGDSFSEPALNKKWRVGTLTGGRLSLDPQVETSVQSGRLEVKPRSRPGRSYSGYVTLLPHDMTASHARVEVVQVTENTADTIFAVGQDSNNWYGFVEEGGKLYLQMKMAGKKNSTNVDYDPAEHRFWRLRHEATDNLMLWETSPDGVKWTILRSTTPEIPLVSLYMYLGAGTYLVEASPGSAIFDNFKFVIHAEP